MFTSDLKRKASEGTDSKVYIELVGSNNKVTERIWLDKNVSVSKNKDLFETGQCDEFLIKTKNFKKVSQIRIGHDNSGFGSGWHLSRVEVINKSDSKQYEFPCNRWLAKDEDDKKIERIIDAVEKPSGNLVDERKRSTTSSKQSKSEKLFSDSSTSETTDSILKKRK